MEVVLLVAVFAVVVYFVSRNRNNGSRHHIRPPKRVISPRTGTEDGPWSTGPFDHSTAKRAPQTTSVTGPAQIIDGDTIVIKKTQIRLFGIDAPELNHPYGRKAKWALIGLCKGKSVRADIVEKDAYGRTVAKCFLPDGRDLSSEMVKRGWAIDWPKFSGGIYTHLEVAGARKKMWLADARQNGRMYVWEKFEAQKGNRR